MPLLLAVEARASESTFVEGYALTARPQVIIVVVRPIERVYFHGVDVPGCLILLVLDCPCYRY